MFDLPVETAIERKAYRTFRKALINEGFVMIQFSVYVRVCASANSAKYMKLRVQKFLQADGLVQTMMLTEKQYLDMHFLLGKPLDDVRNTSDRTVII